jgi:hypothetical protein
LGPLPFDPRAADIVDSVQGFIPQIAARTVAETPWNSVADYAADHGTAGPSGTVGMPSSTRQLSGNPKIDQDHKRSNSF